MGLLRIRVRLLSLVFSVTTDVISWLSVWSTLLVLQLGVVQVALLYKLLSCEPMLN